MNKTTSRIVNLIFDEISAKSEDSAYDEHLISAIEAFVTEKSLAEKWISGGFDDNLLGRWLEAYLAPIKDLDYTEACNWFINRNIHRRVEDALSAFDGLDADNRTLTDEQVRKMYFDLRNLIAPLVARPEYDLYVEQVTVRARLSMDRYLNGCSG